MSLISRKELLNQLTQRYPGANWAEKRRILDEFVAATGYARKYAVALLNHGAQLRNVEKVSRQSPPRRYHNPVREALITIWIAANRICAKRLIPFLPEFVPSLERFGHLTLTDEVRQCLLSMSAATADRLLQRQRITEGRSISTTRRGTLLKHQIPVRMFAEWSEREPGFMEADLVAHCGDRVEGAYLHTLVLTDIATGWTECLALLRRSEADVIGAMEVLRQQLPFPLLGLDTDNGGEFVNYELVHYCRQNHITFTRSRAYRKNDQAHVEEKNGSVVRRLIGYDRYEGIAAWNALTALYRVVRQYLNFFQPSMKLLSKERIGSRIVKRYDPARTPYDRILDAVSMSEEIKIRLHQIYGQLDPLKLLTEMESLQDKFWEHAHSKAPVISSLPAAGQATDEGSNSVKPVIIVPSTPPLTMNPTLAAPSPNAPRTYRKTKRPSVPHTWRTRKDPFADVCRQLQLRLRLNPSLTAKELLAELQQGYPGMYPDSQLRTLQRRVRRWRYSQLYGIQAVQQNEFAAPSDQPAGGMRQ